MARSKHRKLFRTLSIAFLSALTLLGISLFLNPQTQAFARNYIPLYSTTSGIQLVTTTGTGPILHSTFNNPRTVVVPSNTPVLVVNSNQQSNSNFVKDTGPVLVSSTSQQQFVQNDFQPNFGLSGNRVLFYDHDQVGFCPAGYTELGGDRALRIEYDFFFDTNNRSARMCILNAYQNSASPFPASGLVTRSGQAAGPWTQVTVFLNFEEYPSCPANYTQLGGGNLRIEYDYNYDTNNRSGRFCVRNDRVNDFVLVNAERREQNSCPFGWYQFGGSEVRIEYDFAQNTNNRSGRLCIRQ